MNIVIIRNAASYDFGGGERFPVFLAEALQDRYQTTVVSRSEKLLALAQRQDIPCIRGWWWSWQNWSSKRVFLSPLYFGWQILLTGWYIQLFLRLRPCVVHLQSKDDFIAGTLAGRLVGARVIWTDHADLKHVWKNVRVWYKNPVGKAVYICALLAHAITVVSKSELHLVRANLPVGGRVAHKLQVVYNGVFDRYDELKVMPYEHPTFVCASRLVVDKGIGELLAAFETVHNHYPDSELHILGEGPDRKQFDHHQPGVTFFGHVDNPLQHIARACIFVHPTYHEGFSVALVEASMLGRAIIATDVGGNPEIVHDGNTGLLVPARNISALAAAMERLLSDAHLRAHLGVAARQQYLSTFQFDAIVHNVFVPLYEAH